MVLDLFTTFVSTYCSSLSGFQRVGPYQALQNSPLHTDVSGAYASIKLWLLLVQHAATQRRRSTEAFGESHRPGLIAGTEELLTSKMIWNELWPPFERVMTVLEADTHAGHVTASVQRLGQPAILTFFRRRCPPRYGPPSQTYCCFCASLGRWCWTKPLNSLLSNAYAVSCEANPRCAPCLCHGPVSADQMSIANACGAQYQRTTPGLAVRFLCQPGRHGVACRGEAACCTQARHFPGADTENGQLKELLWLYASTIAYLPNNLSLYFNVEAESSCSCCTGHSHRGFRTDSCALLIDDCQSEEERDSGYPDDQDKGWYAHGPLSRWKVVVDWTGNIEEWLQFGR